MATLNYIRETRQSASVMKRVINYCMQDYKVTDPDSGRRYVSGIGCDGENSYTEFMATKKCFGKASGVFFYQYEQSFSPDEKITPETAHTVALEFAERAWQGHEVLVTTHVDRHHLHTHFVINSVSYRDGSKLRQSPKTLEKLRALNDEICQAHGLSILEPYTGGGMHISTREYRAAMKGESWKFRLMATINHAMERSGTREDFIREMEGLGYQVRWTDERKYITYTCEELSKSVIWLTTPMQQRSKSRFICDWLSATAAAPAVGRRLIVMFVKELYVPHGRNVVFLSNVFDNENARHSADDRWSSLRQNGFASRWMAFHGKVSVRRTRVSKRHTLRGNSYASRLSCI